ESSSGWNAFFSPAGTHLPDGPFFCIFPRAYALGYTHAAPLALKRFTANRQMITNKDLNMSIN
ncbi:MAG: hypothetical protein ACE15F_13695, partial [bacterium]